MHLASGLFFERLPGGWVRMTKRETTDRDSPFVFEMTTDANGWASIVDAMRTEEEVVDGSTPEFVLTRVAPEPVGDATTGAALELVSDATTGAAPTEPASEGG